MKRMRGSYPGGPRHGVRPEQDAGAAPVRPLESMEQREGRLGSGFLRRQGSRRSRRIRGGILVAIAVAALVGLQLGLYSHRTSEEITGQRTEADRESNLSDETNRVLLELWRMEEAEKRVTPP